jgi:hypothetical protein
VEPPEHNEVISTDCVGDFVKDLNKELDVFRVTFNRRVTYFAAYQNVSDSVCHPPVLHSNLC